MAEPGGGGGIEAQGISFLLEAKDALSGILKRVDAAMEKTTAGIETGGARIAASTDKVAVSAAKDFDRFEEHLGTVIIKAAKTTEDVSGSFQKLGKNLHGSISMLGKELAKIGEGGASARKVFVEQIAGMKDPFRDAQNQAKAMSQVLIDTAKKDTTANKQYTKAFVAENATAIKDTLAVYRKFGKAVPKELDKVEKEILELEEAAGKAAKRTGGTVDDLIEGLRGLSLSSTVKGALGVGIVAGFQGAAEETDRASVAGARTGLDFASYGEINALHRATGATLDSITEVNEEFARLSHLGPQSFQETGEQAIKLSRVTNMGTREAAKFTGQLQQYWGLTGVELEKAQARTVALSKLSGVAVEEFADLRDTLKFVRFALDGNVEAANRMAQATERAVAQMGQYGIDAKAVVSDIQGLATGTGGMEAYQKRLQTLIMGGMSPREAMKLLDDAASGDEDAIERYQKAKNRTAVAIGRMTAGAGGAAISKALAADVATTTTDIENADELIKRQAMAKGLAPGSTPEGAKGPITLEKALEKQAVMGLAMAEAMTEFKTAGDHWAEGRQKVIAAAASTQEEIYGLQKDAAELFSTSVGSFAESLAGWKHKDLLGTAITLGGAALTLSAVFKGVKGLFHIMRGTTAAAASADVMGDLMKFGPGGRPGMLARSPVARGAIAARGGLNAAAAAIPGVGGALSGGAGAAFTGGAAAVATTVAAVLAAGAVGVAIGTLINKYLLSDKVKTKIGDFLAKITPGVGDSGKEALAAAEADALGTTNALRASKEAAASGDILKRARAMEFQKLKTEGRSLGIAGLTAADKLALQEEVGRRIAAGEAINVKIMQAFEREGLEPIMATGTALQESMGAAESSAKRIEDSLSTAADAAEAPGHRRPKSRLQIRQEQAALAAKGQAGVGGGSTMGQAIARQEGFFLDQEAKGKQPTVAQRNNNPGNIRVYGWKKGMDAAESQKRAQQQGAVGHDERGFLQFQTPEQGFKGIDRQLAIYAKRDPDITVAEAIKKWAPPHENDTGAYIASLKRQGLDPNMTVVQALGMSTPGGAGGAVTAGGSMAPRGAASETVMASAATPPTVSPATPAMEVVPAAPVEQTPENLVASADAGTGTQVTEFPDPFTGMTQGDQLLVAEMKRTNALLGRMAAASRAPGPPVNVGPSDTFQDIERGA